MENTRRWSGFVCPDCRFVFRVPRDHDGQGIVCPSCRRMLKIPTADDTPPPLMAPLRRVEAEAPEGGEAETIAEDGSRRVKRRRRKKGSSGRHSWEQGGGGRRGHSGEAGQFRMWLVVGGMLLLATLGSAIFVMKGSGDAPPVVAKPIVTEPAAEKAPEVIARSEASLLEEAEPLVRKFLEAKTVDELLPLVRNPDVAGPRMREFYPDGKIQPTGLSAFNTGGGLAVRGKFASVGVRTGSYEDRQLAVFETPDGLRVDWESWAGWSDISWKDFLTEKPQQPHVFRVTLTEVEYYNFGFSDDSKWQSFRLISTDGEHAVYGYAPRDSGLALRIRPAGDAKSAALMLELKFPPDPQSDNQVEIASMVAEGWVEDEAAP